MPVSQAGSTANKTPSTPGGSTACTAGLDGSRGEAKKTERYGHEWEISDGVISNNVITCSVDVDLISKILEITTPWKRSLTLFVRGRIWQTSVIRPPV